MDKFIGNCKSNLLINNYKIIQNYTSSIYYLSKLNDGRLVSCSADGELRIFKKDNIHQLQLTIKLHSHSIYSFIQLNNEKIITCSYEAMIIIKLIGEENYQIEQVLKEYYDTFIKVIEIKENELISISYNGKMKIWILNNEYKFECITTIIFQIYESWSNILKLNEKEFVTLSCDEKCIKFYNSNNYFNFLIINNLEMNIECVCLLNNDLFCVGGTGFYLIKISTHQFIKHIHGLIKINYIFKCLNELILCSIIDKNKKYSLIKYKYEKENLIKIDEILYDKKILSCIEMNDGTIICGGVDNIIQLGN